MLFFLFVFFIEKATLYMGDPGSRSKIYSVVILVYSTFAGAPEATSRPQKIPRPF